MKRLQLLIITAILCAMQVQAENSVPSFEHLDNSNDETTIVISYPEKCVVSDVTFFNNGKEYKASSLTTQFDNSDGVSRTVMTFPMLNMFKNSYVIATINGNAYKMTLPLSGFQRRSSKRRVFESDDDGTPKFSSLDNYGISTSITITCHGAVKSIGKPVMTNNGRQYQAKSVKSRYNAKRNETTITAKFKYIDNFVRCSMTIQIDGIDYQMSSFTPGRSARRINK